MCVNALSGLYLISTKRKPGKEDLCPSLVSMPSRAYTSFLQRGECIDVMHDDLRCQCPLGLIPHFYTKLFMLYLESSRSIVSMPSRAYTSFLRYPFKNLGFMRFPEPVFAGICQNILATAVFRAC